MHHSPCLWALALVTLLSGCEKEDDGTNTAGEILRFYTNTELTADQPYVVSGNEMVFHRHYTKEDNEMIFDDEYSENFFFQVNNPGQAFQFDGGDLKALNHVFRLYCYCSQLGETTLTGGVISGVRTSNATYKIEVDVDYEHYVIDSISGDTLQTISRQLNYKGVHYWTAKP